MSSIKNFKLFSEKASHILIDRQVILARKDKNLPVSYRIFALQTHYGDLFVFQKDISALLSIAREYDIGLENLCAERSLSKGRSVVWRIKPHPSESDITLGEWNRRKMLG